MKPKKPGKRLTISKESLQDLEDRTLGAVVAAAALPATKVASGCVEGS